MPSAVATVPLFLVALAISLIVVVDTMRGENRLLGVISWPLGKELPAPDKDSEPGIRETLFALSLVLTQLVTMVLSQIGKQPLSIMSFTFLIFCMVSCAILGGVICIIRSVRIKDDGGKGRTYDSATIASAKWVLFWLVTFSVFVPLFAVQGQLPGQLPPRVLEPTEIVAHSHTFTKGPPEVVNSQGIAVTFKITGTDVRDKTRIEVDLSTKKEADLLRSYRIVAVKLYLGEPSTDKEYSSPPSTPENLSDITSPVPTSTHVILKDLQGLGRGEYYTVQLLLWKIESTKLEVSQAIEEIPNGLSIRLQASE